ncbi:hypothetical protein DWF00_27110 [Bosea caraganae]|uniref:Uncharacterized protein n=1 Tax=Bosea caraganae TaxID=2763117 RepID=A0A370L9G8_9HYPH|nr:hypothetical protein [Bosea caraganae]RDJ21992.1 hypothetical protein DWF00_27110 [Bosea caraganae]RDJ27974.1 hypothetical protein DWE98_05045 [Bosea caraganae]
MIHLGPNLTRRDTDETRASRRRAAAVATTFGDRNQKGPALDFNAKASPAAPSSGMGVSFADAYAPSWKAEMAERDERAARLDKLPPAVQRLATEQGMTELPMLEVIAIISRACKTMGGNPAQCWASDIGRAIGVSTQKTEEILREAAQRGFIEPRANSYWRSKL